MCVFFLLTDNSHNHYLIWSRLVFRTNLADCEHNGSRAKAVAWVLTLALMPTPWMTVDGDKTHLNSQDSPSSLRNEKTRVDDLPLKWTLLDKGLKPPFPG